MDLDYNKSAADIHESGNSDYEPEFAESDYEIDAESDHEPEPDIDPEVSSQDDSESQLDPVISNIKHFDASEYEHGVAIAPLYEGASVTVLETVAQHLLWFTDHPGTSKRALTDILHMQHHSINVILLQSQIIVKPWLVQIIYGHELIGSSYAP